MRADGTSVENMTHRRNGAWLFARTAIREDTGSKKPDRSRPDPRAIITTKRKITSMWIERKTSLRVRTPKTSISAPPSIAASGRSIGKRRIVRSEIRTCVARKMAVAATST